MSDTHVGGLPSLAEIGAARPIEPRELDTVGRLVDRYSLGDDDRQLLAAMLGI